MLQLNDHINSIDNQIQICTFMDESAISPVHKLSTFIEGYPAANLRDQFKLLQADFPDHRKVKGDGNCLYRAFAFQYLTKVKIEAPSFPSCKNICKDSRYSEQQFSRKFNQIIEELSELDCQIKDQIIEERFNSQEFDQIIITYFRSANYSFIKNNTQKYFQYISEDKLVTELDRISTINTETEGIELPALAQLFNVRLYIFFIDQQTFNPIVFNESKGEVSIYLFYRPGHYDIVYPREDQKQSKIRPKLKIKPKAAPIKKVDEMIKKVNVGSRLSTPQPPKSIFPKPQPKPEPQQLKSTQRNRPPISGSLREQNQKQYAESLQRKINKPKNIKTSQSWNEPSKVIMEFFAVGLMLSFGYFIYSISGPQR